MASLRVVGADGSEKLVELRERKLLIGRGRDNDIVLEDPEKGVSRTHAELRFENGRYVIVDLQSQNGTWINGVRVDRAEVPPGSEVTIGDYRLTLQKEAAQRPAGAAGATVARPVRDVGDLELRERPERPQRRERPERPAYDSRPVYRPDAAATPGPRTVVVGALLVAVAVILLGAVAWVWIGRGGSEPAGAVQDAPKRERPAEASAPPPAAPADPLPAPPERAAEGAEPFVPKTGSPRRAPTERPRVERVARKPGESLEAWRSRSEALATRYAYSKAALERRDYAAAAGGFQAILLEEPGFLDAAQLLVQANAGLRATANGLFASGKRLDSAGDWVGALQKYEQARQIYSGIPGIAHEIQRVREKLRAAGTKAFAEAKQLDAMGRRAEAIQEYQKAVQWLPADDSNRQAARARLEQLKKDQ